MFTVKQRSRPPRGGPDPVPRSTVDEEQEPPWREVIGPGVITGAADDDPSGIATYAQTGAQFGYGQLWTAVFMLPLLIGVQEACARIGAVTGLGLAAAIGQRYNRGVLLGVAILVLIANTINIGADLGAMAAATHLLLPVNVTGLAIGFAVLILVLEISLSYRVYAHILRWLVLSLLAYPLAVLIIRPPAFAVLKASFLPHLEFSFAFLFIIVGVLGTTISPYMFFWETSEEVEESRLRGWTIPGRQRWLNGAELWRLRVDNVLGMGLSEAATWSIIVVTGTVLHNRGITTIRTAADGARALEPLVHTFPHAGVIARTIFATGVIGLGLLGVPVLAGSAAYAAAEAFRWNEGLDRKAGEARGFYVVIAGATIVGLLISMAGINPMKALVYAAVINGFVAVPLIALIARIASNETMMGPNRSGRLSTITVWTTFGLMALAALGVVVSLGGA